ncbi:MAG TPA: DUF5665 domain-containing protein [Candidatus Saccharimonadales bacterium]|nr:DUF5665 domain-containing protein [Candidatus Saccharimonadales bacterium]
MDQQKEIGTTTQQQDGKTVEKHYIEVNPSKWSKFVTGLLSGFGYGIGLTLGTAVFLLIIGVIISKVNFVPIFGNFLSDVIKSAQGSLLSK